MSFDINNAVEQRIDRILLDAQTNAVFYAAQRRMFHKEFENQRDPRNRL